jgi:5'(3')-deoxyribonucleotidase
VEPPLKRLSNIEKQCEETEQKMLMEEMQTYSLNHIKSRDKLTMLFQKTPIAELQNDIECVAKSIKQVDIVSDKNEGQAAYF